MRFNTQDLIKTLNGKNKAFITRVAKHQEERYGNVDVFSAIIYPREQSWKGTFTKIEIQFGENWIDFSINDKGEIVDTYGNGQGHKYHKSLEQCAKELFARW